MALSEQTINALLEGQSSTAMILALAWHTGLTRQEIQQLQWSQVSLSQWRITLPNRTVSFASDLALRLSQVADQTGHVVQGRQGALRPQSISRLAHTTLQNAGLDLRLCDLRHDYILRQLTHRSWVDVAQELDMSQGDLRKAYGGKLTAPPPTPSPMVARESAIHGLIQVPTLGTLAVALAFYHGYSSQQLRTLQWQNLPPLPQMDTTTLRPSDGDGLVFPMTASALSRLAQQVLHAQGVLGVTLQTLAGQHHRREPLRTILSHLETHQSLTCGQAQALLNLPKSPAYRLLQGCVGDGALVQVGEAYYSAQHVPPLNDHQPLVLSLAHRRGAVYAEDVETLLHLRPNHCQRLLKTMVSSGQLVRFGTRYQLSPE
ncbi:hypothetical protein RFF05_10535 [Bengtsoniella intestinalis]|uniref:hypothetical protein n=1 Tax=Bengtsoniella intestinalis TaxID=3073143 RepID=UPI00391F57D5